jgi:PAS domain S-box-containing protein
MARGQLADTQKRLSRTLVLFGVLGTMGMLLVHMLITGRLATRLRAVAQNARQLAHGAPLGPVAPGTDEIAVLVHEIENAARLLGERERELRESEHRYRDLFDQAPVPYEETDAQGTIRRVNQAVCGMLRARPAQLIGHPAWEMVSPGEQEQVSEGMLRRIAAGEEAAPFECEYQLTDGTYLTVEVREKLIRNASGEVSGTVRSLLDVTERNLAAMAAKKVSQYAMELRIRNEQLARALDAAQSATVAKSRFLANVSHELRTPLNGIIGFSELLHDRKIGPLSDEQLDVIADILTSGRHLLGLINDVLDLSKVEAGRMEFYPEPHRVSELVREVRDVIRPLAEKKRLSLTVECPDEIHVVLDGSRFKQVVYNYLSNSVKFTADGGSIAVRVRAEGTERFRLEVEDTGIGIEEQEIPRLFQEFGQLGNRRKTEQGTGLGLALTRHLVEAQGGTVGVSSKVSKGSIFFAVLPVAIEPRIANASE